jgi:4-hydroxyproline epimerase
MGQGVFRCIDAHTCGNPVRVVTEGCPALNGANMSEKRQHFLKEYDWIRKGLMFEPRGHDMMSGSLLFPPADPKNDLGILFIETSGCLPMCGHGTIGTVTVAVQEGLVQPQTPGILRLETPAGLVIAEYGKKGHRVDWVKITNVPSYLAAENLQIDFAPLGPLNIDVAYGGNYYAIVEMQEHFGGAQEYKAEELIGMARQLRRQLRKEFPTTFVHPNDPHINGISHILWTGKPKHPDSSASNAVFYGDKAIDRSPCGTGTSARMAQRSAKGLLKKGQAFLHESFIGSVFEGQIEDLTEVGAFPAIIPSIKGWARVYGHNVIEIDPEDDPYAHGFQVI